MSLLNNPFELDEILRLAQLESESGTPKTPPPYDDDNLPEDEADPIDDPSVDLDEDDEEIEEIPE